MRHMNLNMPTQYGFLVYSRTHNVVYNTLEDKSEHKVGTFISFIWIVCRFSEPCLPAAWSACRAFSSLLSASHSHHIISRLLTQLHHRPLLQHQPLQLSAQKARFWPAKTSVLYHVSHPFQCANVSECTNSGKTRAKRKTKAYGGKLTGRRDHPPAVVTGSNRLHGRCDS